MFCNNILKPIVGTVLVILFMLLIVSEHMLEVITTQIKLMRNTIARINVDHICLTLECYSHYL